MFKPLQAFLLTLLLAFTSFGMAVARGHNPDMGDGNGGMVICTGLGLVTITIGPDGTPVETTEVCPDALSQFVPDMLRPVVAEHQVSMAWRENLAHSLVAVLRQTLIPSARGPPLMV